MIKEGNQSNLLMPPDVGGVVDDDVEGAMLLCHAIQKCSAATVANLDSDALVCVLPPVVMKITSDDLALGKIISPDAKRSSMEDTEFQEPDRVVPHRREIAFIGVEVSVPSAGFVGSMFASKRVESRLQRRGPLEGES